VCANCNFEFVFDILTLFSGRGKLTHSLSEYRVIRLLTTRIIHQGYSDSVYRQNAWTETRNIVYKPWEMRTEGHCKTVASALWSIALWVERSCWWWQYVLRNFDNQLRPHSSNCRNGSNVTWLARYLWWGRSSLRSHNSQIFRHLCYYRQLNTECADLAFRTLALCMGDIGFKPPPNIKQSRWRFSCSLSQVLKATVQNVSPFKLWLLPHYIRHFSLIY